jgi:hypothetical protein
LRSLRDLTKETVIELILAHAADVSIEASVRPIWPEARFVSVAGKPSTPELRAAGLSAARCKRRAMLSEDYTLDPSWLDAAITNRTGVTAGVVEPPPGASWTTRAIYLWEYSHAAPPQREGALGEAEARLAPAGCVVYGAGAADPAELAGSASELDYHAAMFRRGVAFQRDAALRAVYHPPPLGTFVRDRRRWSREWARARSRGKSGGARAAAALSRLLLPALLLLRLARNVAARPRWAATAVTALPLYVVFACAQALGETAGFLGGGDG